MTADERRTIDAAKALARRVREYHAVVDAPGLSFTSLEYVIAANAMEAAETALVEAAEPLLDE